MGDFSLNTRHSQLRCIFTDNAASGGEVVAVEAGLYVLFCCVLAADVLEATLVLVTELVLSSFFAFINVCFVKSCASALCFNQSVQSRSVGFTHCFSTVKSEDDSSILGGNFCTAGLNSEAVFKSALYESDLKIPIKLEIVAEQFMILSQLYIFKGGKELSLSICALWLAKLAFKCSKCFFIRYAALRTLIDCVFAFPDTRVFR